MGVGPVNLHPHLAARPAAPPRTADQHGHSINDRIAGRITGWVGTMWCFYLFAALALVSLPAALRTGSLIVIDGWVAQTFLQLVLLAVLQTSGNISSRAADARAEATWKDAEATIHTLLQVEQHLLEQDRVLAELIRARP